VVLYGELKDEDLPVESTDTFNDMKKILDTRIKEMNKEEKDILDNIKELENHLASLQKKRETLKRIKSQNFG
jgi:prefoldin subunit 5